MTESRRVRKRSYENKRHPQINAASQRGSKLIIINAAASILGNTVFTKIRIFRVYKTFKYS